MEGAFLQIISGVRQGLNVQLHDDRAVLVGRRSGDLILDDPMVSGRHCSISYDGSSFVLKDLGSTNGTLVNGKRVKEATLSPGAEITIGQSRMILFHGAEAARDNSAREPRRQAPQLEIAWLLDEELVEVQNKRSGSPPDVIGQDLRLPPGLNAVVEVVAGQDAGKVFRFTRGNVSIGRRTGEVPLTDVEVSRHHAVIEVFGRDMVFVRDLGSTNGTYHNGRRIAVSRLQNGDTVGCGKTVMKLQIRR